MYLGKNQGNVRGCLESVRECHAEERSRSVSPWDSASQYVSKTLDSSLRQRVRAESLCDSARTFRKTPLRMTIYTLSDFSNILLTVGYL